MESRTKNRKSRAQIERMVAVAFAGSQLAEGSDAVTELGEGWFNVAYVLRLASRRRVVLKIAPPPNVEVMSYERDMLRAEVGTLQLVSKNPNIPAPALLFHDATLKECDAPYFFMEWLPGENLEKVKARFSESEFEAIQRTAGCIVREINEFTGDCFGYPAVPELRAACWADAFRRIVDSVLEDGRRNGATYGYDPDLFREFMERSNGVLRAVEVPRLVHWDAWDSNFLVQNGAISGLLDFERALWADPLMEAQFREVPSGITPALRSYGKTAFSHDEECRMWLYTLHLGLVMKTESLYRAYDSEFVSNTGAEYIEASVQFLRKRI